MTPIRFGKASLSIEQSGLQKVAGEGKRYIENKKIFNELVTLSRKDKYQKRLGEMSDLTSVSVFAKKDVDGTFRIKGSVTSVDPETSQTVSLAFTKRLLEGPGGFWRRVMRGARKLDDALQGPDKNGHYTIKEQKPQV